MSVTQPEQSSIIDSSGTKWSLVQTGDNEVTMTQDIDEAPPPPAEDGTPRRVRRVACSCPNCKDVDKSGGGAKVEGKKKVHICHHENCGKVYGKTSHLRAHLR